MDTVPRLALRLGISLPKAHTELDRLGVPRTRRGLARKVPDQAYRQICDRIGAVPEMPEGMTREAILVLAAIMREPLGAVSARQIGQRAGISPTAASKYLQVLNSKGLVEQRSRMEARGKALLVARWHPTPYQQWPPRVFEAVLKARLPKPQYPLSAGRVPYAFHHLFWSVNPNELRLPADAEYVAHQMLTSNDYEAIRWALTHLPISAVDRAVAIRGVDPRTKGLSRMAVHHE